MAGYGPHSMRSNRRFARLYANWDRMTPARRDRYRECRGVSGAAGTCEQRLGEVKPPAEVRKPPQWAERRHYGGRRIPRSRSMWRLGTHPDCAIPLARMSSITWSVAAMRSGNRANNAGRTRWPKKVTLSRKCRLNGTVSSNFGQSLATSAMASSMIRSVFTWLD